MRLFLIIAALFSFVGFYGCDSDSQYQVDGQLTTAEQDSFKYSIIRYAGHLPKRAKEHTKWDSMFDETYLKQAQSFVLDKYFRNEKDGYIYFQVRRIAPSFQKKYVATGGRVKYDENGNIREYEEIYRTWKLDEEKLAEKSKLFFDGMVKGADLSKYYTDNIGDTEHIEFPDANTFFDKESRKWAFRGERPAGPQSNN